VAPWRSGKLEMTGACRRISTDGNEVTDHWLKRLRSAPCAAGLAAAAVVVHTVNAERR
jgi:hypothetical protein